MIKPELLAPAGSWDCVRAAVSNGADAIFFGLPKLNARIRADNFSEEDLPELMRYVHDRGVKAYVTLNTLVFTDELPEAERFLTLLHQNHVDAAIVQDIGLCELARRLVPDFPIHASTQMTLTSPEGLRFARKLGLTRAVLARELSLRELEKFKAENILPLEVFVHGALCVAYSGQCLTSEALGQRSANRGECAQACRMPYQLLVDDVLKDLGDRSYLLSPQDLAAVEEIPRLIELGIECFKIEGRLKAPEYVAAVCQVYRKAIDHAWDARTLTTQSASSSARPITKEDHYKLEMTFSRGLYSGWFHGVNHQELVHARYGKKRGPFVGRIESLGKDYVEVSSQTPLSLGDGIVFDTGGDTNHEQGGRIYQINGKKLFFEHQKINFHQLKRGDRIWKTDDPRLEKELQKSFKTDAAPLTYPVSFTIDGCLGQPLQVTATTTQAQATCCSTHLLATAENRPLTDSTLHEQFSRLGGTPFHLDKLLNNLPPQLIIPLSELNRIRRELVSQLISAATSQPIVTQEIHSKLPELLAEIPHCSKQKTTNEKPVLSVLCRSLLQLQTALDCAVTELYVDFEDIRRYREAVELVRHYPAAQIILATPRIQKVGEQGFFKLIEKALPDGVLIRNLGALSYFQTSPLRKIGDFSLNVANPLSAQVLMNEGLERLTLSYDLNVDQVISLVQGAPAHWFDLTIHQHMPMFHMEHCVFAAFLSTGTDHTNCGRPCDRHQIKLRDRVGAEHPVKADVGCRNTVFNQKAQSGAGYFGTFLQTGLSRFRVELLNESAEQAKNIVTTYQGLMEHSLSADELINTLHVKNQLGVTSGTLTVLSQ
ncbi:MAG: U32 family peptidase [Blastochloris sp.]|nr:U32 family peptidase [Blastochloris sp.]